jgi:hypothetical protein
VGWFGEFTKEYGGLGTALAAIAAGVWAFTTYSENAKREYIKDFNTKQINTFFQTAETVSSIVAESDSQKWNEWSAKFWNLHYGDLVLFENPGIECAMTYFGFKLNATRFEGRGQLGPYAFAVSQELRRFIEQLNQREWKINLVALSGAKEDIAPLLGLKGERLVQDFNQTAKSQIDAKCKDYMAPPRDIGASPP